MTSQQAWLKYGLTSPPADDNPFNRWQAQVDLIMLEKIHEIDRNCPMCQGRWRMAKILLGVCATLTAVAATCAALLKLGK